jgi:small-conductance mechanosensitive channel
MLQVESKIEDCAQQRSAGASYKAIVLSASVLVLLAVLMPHRHCALSQQLPASEFDAQARSRDILAHLNSLIQFYRACTQPLQKAGEPNDVVYRDQAVALSSAAAGFAFQWARAEAELMSRYQTHGGASPNSSVADEQRLQAREKSLEEQISDLEARGGALDKEIATANPHNIAILRAQRKQVQGALDLANAMKDAMQKVVGMSEAQGGTGFSADVERLQRSVPELQSNNKTAAPQLVSLDSARSSGVTSQVTVLLELFETRQSLDTLIGENDDLHQHALAFRTPISNALRNLIRQGQQLSQQAANLAALPPTAATQHRGSANAAPTAAAEPNIESITTAFKALSAAAVPLSQEIIVLEQSRANLADWQTSVGREYKSILHSLLLRVLVIGLALALVLGGGEVWSRATHKYIRDVRRRRQLLLVRRVVVGFLCVIVILFGFVTQFNSLATFAGFITAGIAIGLQTILLSVAAYFFIIGRYGVKVGDRITISSVTGDVIEVGLVRFYVMELAGSGPELHPTGRVAVFSNAVLFQAGTPLYKQMPGTEYAWHELIVKLTDTANYKIVCEAISKEVQAVYDGYRTNIEQQHQSVQNWMRAAIDPPVIESRLQLNGGAFQLWARFPVQIKHASETDEKLIQALLELMAKRPEIKSAVASTPLIQASVRG